MKIIRVIKRYFLSISLLSIYLSVPFILKSQARAEAIAMDVYFRFNKYSVDSIEKEKIVSYTDKLLKLNAQADSIAIYGLTDTVGTKTYNKRLAYRRCKTVDSLIESLLHKRILLSFKLVPVGESQEINESDSLQRKASLIVYVKRTDTLRASIADLVKRDKIGPRTDELDKNNVLEVDTVIMLSNIYFRPDTPDITPESLPMLDNYKYIIRKYPNNFIEVGGYVNHKYSVLKPGDPLFTLSVERAKVIMEYFVQNGCNPKLITYKGYGNSKLVITNPKNLEEKMKNMRVELKIFKTNR